MLKFTDPVVEDGIGRQSRSSLQTCQKRTPTPRSIVRESPVDEGNAYEDIRLPKRGNVGN